MERVRAFSRKGPIDSEVISHVVGPSFMRRNWFSTLLVGTMRVIVFAGVLLLPFRGRKVKRIAVDGECLISPAAPLRRNREGGWLRSARPMERARAFSRKGPIDSEVISHVVWPSFMRTHLVLYPVSRHGAEIVFGGAPLRAFRSREVTDLS